MRQIKKKTETRQFLKASTAALRDDLDLCFLLQDWQDPYNVGGLFRVADACGAVKVVCSGKTPVPPHPQISVTSLGNHRRVDFEQFARHDAAIESLKKDGYQLIAVEVADQAVPYTQFRFEGKVCLVLGNEAKGIYPGTLKACNSAVYIPMAGKGRSINVMVAAAVVAFHARADIGNP